MDFVSDAVGTAAVLAVGGASAERADAVFVVKCAVDVAVASSEHQQHWDFPYPKDLPAGAVEMH